jgi:hypothetical protein
VLFIDGNGHGPGVVLKKPTAEPASAPKTGARAKAVSGLRNGRDGRSRRHKESR